MKHKRRYDSLDIICFLVLTILAVLIIVPFWNAVVISLETAGAYQRKPFSWLPVEFTLANYKYLMSKAQGLIQAYLNTIKIAVVSTALGLAVETMVAYGFTRHFPGKKPLFYVMLFSMFFGGGLIPTYLLIKNMGLLDTHTAVILLGLASTYNIIVMKNAFESIPAELPEAALVDGASDITIFLRVMLPLQKPVLATFALFHVVGAWNNWYWPMLVLNSSGKSVLQLFVRSLINNAGAGKAAELLSAVTDESQVYTMGIQMAAVFVVIVPIMLVYPFLQKYYVKGVLIGSVKM